MKPLYLLLVLGLVSCGGKPTNVDYGKTTVSDLIAQKGEPLEEEQVPVPESKILVYPENEKYQTKGQLVTHGFKNPTGDERTVIYWKHKFRDCDTTTKKISEPQGHEIPEFELSCPAQGITVIYSNGSEFVTRVIEHEKR